MYTQVKTTRCIMRIIIQSCVTCFLSSYFTHIIFCVLCFLPSCLLIYSSSDDIKSLAIIIRHGHRLPCEAYNGDPYSNFFKTTGYGGLTSTGRLHMFSVGRKLRTAFPSIKKRVITQLTSSIVPRCVESIQYLFRGLTGSNSYIPHEDICVNTTIKDDDAMLNHGGVFCPARALAIDNSRHIQHLPMEFGDLWNNVTLITQTTYSSVHQFVDNLIEPIVSEKLMDLHMPDWATDELLRRAAAAIDRTIFLTGSLEIEGKLSGVFYREIIDQFNRDAQSNDVSFFAYGTHDTTLGPILVNLNLWPGHRPYYGEGLVFVLTTGGQLKTLYYDEKHVLHPKLLPGCTESHCTVDSFEKAISHLIPKNWRKECKRDD